MVEGVSFLSLIIAGFQGKTPLFLNPLMALATLVHLSKTVLKISINASLSYDFSILLDDHLQTSCLYVIFTDPINSRSSACSKCVELGRYVCRMILFSSQSSEINNEIWTFTPSISSSTGFSTQHHSISGMKLCSSQL